MFPKNLGSLPKYIYSYNDFLIMYAHIQSSQTMWPAMLTFKTETFQPIPIPLFPLLLSNPSLTTPVKYATDFYYNNTLNNHVKNKVLWQHIRKHLEGAILIPADDKRLNGVTRKTSGRSSWLMVMDVCMCGCQHTVYLEFVLTVLTRFIEKRVKKFDGWSYTTPIK